MAYARTAQGQTGAIVIRALTANNCVNVQKGRVETVKMVGYGYFLRLLSYFAGTKMPNVTPKLRLRLSPIGYFCVKMLNRDLQKSEIGMLYVYSNLTYTHSYAPKCWYTNDRLKAPQMTVHV